VLAEFEGGGTVSYSSPVVVVVVVVGLVVLPYLTHPMVMVLLTLVVVVVVTITTVVVTVAVVNAVDLTLIQYSIHPHHMSLSPLSSCPCPGRHPRPWASDFSCLNLPWRSKTKQVEWLSPSLT
jgi:hypothetical protein